jgi:hypothetical protein
MNGNPVGQVSLQAEVSPAAARWLADSRAAIAADSTAIGSLFPASARRYGRQPLVDSDLNGLTFGCADDEARAALISALADDESLASMLSDLYRYGDAGEKRGVLRCLHLKPGVGAQLLPEVEDALRTNDVRLVAAALQPYGARHLSAQAYRHAIVKCVFVGVPLAAVHGLAERQDSKLAEMLVDLAHERAAAGRPVPPDVGLVIANFTDYLLRPELPAGLIAEITAICTR